MENLYYLICVNENWIEGICLTKNKNNFNIIKDIVSFNISKKHNLDERINLKKNYWIKPLEDFLDEQKWSEHPIAFIIPSEEIIFRKIKFPFQDKKKVEQALPFELKEELIFDLSESTFSTKVQTLPEKKSEALVFLIKSELLNQLKRICLDRELLIRNVDCSSYALFRANHLNDSSQKVVNEIFQVYLGSDEAFVNTIKNSLLDEIKIFPNRIAKILQNHFDKSEQSLHSFLKNFSKDNDKKNISTINSKYVETFKEIKEEIDWLCSQFTLHLRIKNFSSESKIEIYGIFGPVIKWDGVVFRRRTFPLPEAKAFADRYKKNKIKNNSFENKLNLEKSNFKILNETSPNTLQELMEEAKQRENSKENPSIFSNEKNVNSRVDNLEKLKSESSLESVNPRNSILSMIERKQWGILGDLRKSSEIFFENHFLSLYHESTPWRIFLKRNKGKITITASLLIFIILSFVFQKITNYQLLKKEIYQAELIKRSEIKRALPETSKTNINEILKKLRDKINDRKYAIQTSKKFEKREYKNLILLKRISNMLDNDASFRVDSLEITPERFSISGTIDSYDRLQMFKKKLEEIDNFFGKRIIESNRKSPNGIVYRIFVELN